PPAPRPGSARGPFKQGAGGRGRTIEARERLEPQPARSRRSHLAHDRLGDLLRRPRARLSRAYGRATEWASTGPSSSPLTTITSDPRDIVAEPVVWFTIAQPCADQVPTAESRRRCRSSAEMPPRRMRRATMRPITAAARTASATHAQVGVELSELALVVVFAGISFFSVVVCSRVVTTVVAGSVVVCSTGLVTW